MELYFSPMACSLATRIALYEAGAAARFIEVDSASKRTRDGADYWQINPMGQVPALRTEDGRLLTENAAVLQHVGEAFPAAALLPADAAGRDALRQWLGFIGTELHKAVFVPLLDPHAVAEVKAYASEKAALRLSVLERHLEAHDHLVSAFSVADAYLTAVLNWAPYAGVDLAPWPALTNYHRRMTRRPAISRAIGEEFELYKQEQARRKKAA
ncbi:MAG: glutathione S-transferase N-terminal domain-containing protein [Burkholderiales bacterium]|nr:glutathione S-transferase N-terminal domain-containing protein [Burkholderiales bacterium]